MIWKKPMVKIGPVLIEDDHRFIDKVTWSIAYKRGYREPRHPVPVPITEIDVMEPGMIIWHGTDIIFLEAWDATGID